MVACTSSRAMAMPSACDNACITASPEPVCAMTAPTLWWRGARAAQGFWASGVRLWPLQVPSILRLNTLHEVPNSGCPNGETFVAAPMRLDIVATSGAVRGAVAACLLSLTLSSAPAALAEAQKGEFKIQGGGASTLQSGRRITITRGVNLDNTQWQGENLKGVAFQQARATPPSSDSWTRACRGRPCVARASLARPLILAYPCAPQSVVRSANFEKANLFTASFFDADLSNSNFKACACPARSRRRWVPAHKTRCGCLEKAKTRCEDMPVPRKG
eukprot:scaffold5505_cov129-Isochrysis_galbana.AAC.2